MDPIGGESSVIDGLDRVILGELRGQGRLTWRDLGERVGLGATATADRVRRLEALGVLRGFRAEVDMSALGIGLQAITEIRLARTADPEPFKALVRDTPEVQSAMHVTGSLDYVLMLACADVATLDRLLMEWRRMGGVEESSTRIILRTIDLSTELPH